MGYTFSKSGVNLNANYSGTVNLTGGTEEDAAVKSPKHKIDVRVNLPVGQYIENFFETKQANNAKKAQEASAL